jgi:hypothetical protein
LQTCFLARHPGKESRRALPATAADFSIGTQGTRSGSMPTHVLACTVSETGGYCYIARLAPVASPRGLLSFTLCTTWRAAKAPHEERRVLQLHLDAEGLGRLRALLDEGAALALRDIVLPRADGEARDGHAPRADRG